MIAHFFAHNRAKMNRIAINTYHIARMIESVLCAIAAIISCASVIDDENYLIAGEVAIFSTIALMTNGRDKHIGTTSKVAWFIVALLIINTVSAIPPSKVQLSSLATRELLIGLSVNIGMLLLVKRVVYAVLAFAMRILIRMFAENL